MNYKKEIWIGIISFFFVVNVVFLFFHLKQRNSMIKHGRKVVAKVIRKQEGTDGSSSYDLRYPVDGDSIWYRISSLKSFEVGDRVEIYYDTQDVWSLLLADDVETSRSIIIPIVIAIALAVWVAILSFYKFDE